MGMQKRILKEKGVIRLSVTDILRMQITDMNADYGSIKTDTKIRTETRTVRMSFTYNLGSKNVRNARERNPGLSEEAERAQQNR